MANPNYRYLQTARNDDDKPIGQNIILNLAKRMQYSQGKEKRNGNAQGR